MTLDVASCGHLLRFYLTQFGCTVRTEEKKKKEVLRDNSVLMSLGVLSLVIETLIVLLFVCCICFVFYFESKRFQQQTKEDKVLQKRQCLLLLLSESQAKTLVFAHLWSKFYP